MDYSLHIRIISLRQCLRQAKQIWWANKWLMLGLCVFLYALPEATAPMAWDGVFGASIASMTSSGFGSDAAYLFDDLIGYMTDAFIAIFVITGLMQNRLPILDLLGILTKTSFYIIVFALIDWSFSQLPDLWNIFISIGFATFFYLTTPVLVCEQKNTFSAMRRSLDLTRGNRFRFLFVAALYQGAHVSINLAQILMEDGTFYQLLQFSYIDPVYEMARALILSFFAVLYAVIYFELQPDKDRLEDDRTISAFE